MDEINSKLQTWQNAWANNRMRTIRSSPLKLWMNGQAQNPIGLDLPIGNAHEYGVEGSIDDHHEHDDEETRPIFSPPVLEFSENCITELNSIV